MSAVIGCPQGATCCNNVENLCDLPVSDILFGMVHNAMSSVDAGFYVFANHMEDPIVDSLDAGFRGLSLDLCNCNGKMQFCHGGPETGCGIGRRDPVETFGQINDWIARNPNNVVMIWLQVNDGAGDPISLEDIDTIARSVPLGNSNRAFADRLYRRDRYDYSDWPTLAELIRMEQQVLFFYMGGPDGSEEPPPGIHYFYEYGMSTHWAYASVSELRDTVMNGCQVHRRSSNRRDFFMLNDFVTEKVFGIQVKPSRAAAEEINTETFLEALFDVCESSNGMKVNIVSVDFWRSGDLSSFVNSHNMDLVGRNTRSSATPLNDSVSPRSELPQNGLGGIKDLGFGG